MPGGAAAAGTQGHPPNRLHLPLSEHDHEVNMILGALTLELGTVELGTVRSIAGAWGGSARLVFAISEMEMADAAGV